MDTNVMILGYFYECIIPIAPLFTTSFTTIKVVHIYSPEQEPPTPSISNPPDKHTRTLIYLC